MARVAGLLADDIRHDPAGDLQSSLRRRALLQQQRSLSTDTGTGTHRSSSLEGARGESVQYSAAVGAEVSTRGWLQGGKRSCGDNSVTIKNGGRMSHDAMTTKINIIAAY